MFPETLRRLRKEKGMSQKQLAEVINVSSSAISQYERRKASPARENLHKLAEYFNVTVAYLEGTSSIDDIENLLNSDYVQGYSVRDLLDMCLKIDSTDRTHLVYLASLMSRNSDSSEE